MRTRCPERAELLALGLPGAWRAFAHLFARAPLKTQVFFSMDDVQAALAKVEAEIEALGAKLEKVEVDVEAARARQDEAEVAVLRTKEDKLRTEKEQLRTEKEQLRAKEDKLLAKELLMLQSEQGMLALTPWRQEALAAF